jgi:hypothetical protein
LVPFPLVSFPLGPPGLHFRLGSSTPGNVGGQAKSARNGQSAGERKPEIWSVTGFPCSGGLRPPFVDRRSTLQPRSPTAVRSSLPARRGKLRSTLQRMWRGPCGRHEDVAPPLRAACAGLKPGATTDDSAPGGAVPSPTTLHRANGPPGQGKPSPYEVRLRRAALPGLPDGGINPPLPLPSRPRSPASVIGGAE